MARIADRLASCADRFLGAAVGEWAVVDPTAEAGLDLGPRGGILVDDEQTRVFLTGAGFAPDGAYRDRVVSADGEVLREVRLSCTLSA